MANKRIKDLGTTASTLAADDYVAIDGNTNGTRKIVKGDLVNDISTQVAGTYLDEANNLSDVASKDTSKLNLEVPDVGTGPNEVPLNGQLGSMAYQDADSVSVAELQVESTTGTATTQALTVTDGTDDNFVVQEGGNVGVGLSSPSGSGWDESSTVLHVKKDDTSGGLLALESSNTKAILNAGNDQLAIFTTTADPIRLGTSGSEAVRIDASQRVGIGNSSPGTNANVSADDLVVGNGGEHGITIYSGSANNGRLFFSDGTGTDSYRGIIRYDHGSNAMVFGTNSSDRWTINSTGNLVAGANLGIDFGSTNTTTGVTVTGSTLDHFESGTWTPVYSPTSGSFATLTPDITDATYTRIGNICTVSANIKTDDVDVTGASGALRISGLPFDASSSVAAGSVGFVNGWGTAPLGCWVSASSDLIFLAKRSSVTGSTSSIQVSDMTNGTVANANNVYITITYEVA